jgi:hypothetical protein
VDVWIYASHSPEYFGGAKATWRGEYVRCVVAMGDHHHPDGMRHRPPKTAETDVGQPWLLFWHVRDLRRLPPEEHVRIEEFRDRRHGRKANEPYVPEGPMLKLYP